MSITNIWLEFFNLISIFNKETEDEIAPLPREYDKLETSVGEEVYAENIEIEKKCEYHDDAIEIKTLEIIQQTG